LLVIGDPAFMTTLPPKCSVPMLLPGETVEPALKVVVVAAKVPLPSGCRR